jgi:hypothetical protein
MNRLPVEEVLSRDHPAAMPQAIEIGQSREGSTIVGYRLGRGALKVSLIGGCHADEPVGPEMLRRLAGFIATRDPHDSILQEFTWFIVPHVNPDGEQRNSVWIQRIDPAVDSFGMADFVYSLPQYVTSVVRELPGDDIEFGFPRTQPDPDARPETRAVANFLGPEGPFDLHASFHGMGFAPGPWFLLEPSWIERTEKLRVELRRRVQELGYRCFDIDRGGEKGFKRIDEGFSTRPDSAAMIDFFEAQDDSATARKFRPSSMEFVRSLGGDPLTLVSEMPLFLHAEAPVKGVQSSRLEEEVARNGIKTMLSRLAQVGSQQSLERAASHFGVKGMPLRDQMRLQLWFLNAGLMAAKDGR